MEILAPITNLEEMRELSLLGVKEFFCGYMNSEWYEVFNNPDVYKKMVPYPINRRHSVLTNISSLEELKLINEECERLNSRLYLTLNATFYPANTYRLLERYIEQVVSIGVTHFIVSDLGLISYISRNRPEVKLSISCLAQVTNSQAVDFYRQFNPERIVLPRHISIESAKRIMLNNPDIEFECFALGEKCLYDDGFCRCNHALSPFCTETMRSTYYSSDNSVISKEEKEKLLLNESVYNDWSNELIEDVSSLCGKNLGCSLCSIIKLSNIPNMCSWKLSGRGKNKFAMQERIKLVKDIIEMAESGRDIEEAKRLVKNVLGLKYCDDYEYCFMRGE